LWNIFVPTQCVCSLGYMAAINLKVGSEINGYVLGKWVIFIARDFASDGQECSNIQSLTCS
jgi:hypothetical protein